MRDTSLLPGPAVDEWAGVDLGDARLNARVHRVVAALARNPAAGFPAAVDTVAAREATYRLLGNARVTLDALLTPHVQQTVGRAAARGARPLVIIDKTTFVFAGEGVRDGLTRLGPARQGFDAFVALAVGPDRAALGVLAITPLAGESGRARAETWAHVATVADTQIGAQQPIYVMDREADAYALLAALGAAGRDFIVRVTPARLGREHPAAAPALLRDVVAGTPVQLQRTVTLTRRSRVGKPRKTQHRHPPREMREATLDVRACPVVLPRPPKASPDLPATLTVQLVQVVEAHPRADVVPVEWLLVTTLPIADRAAIEAILDGYRARWVIEEYFKALKSGCAYEQRQLESRAALLNALGLLAPLAWRLLAWRTAATAETVPATAVLEDDEVHVLRLISQDIPLGPTPTAADALAALARLGGHFPQNGRPGWKVLWTGFQKLLDRVDGYRLARLELTTGCDQ
jgi:transposase-like protein/DDE family transposase